MPALNLNRMAQAIARREGGKKAMTIAQIKECLRHTLDILSEAPIEDVVTHLRQRLNARLRAIDARNARRP